jgi:hypothetical protein
MCMGLWQGICFYAPGDPSQQLNEYGKKLTTRVADEYMHAESLAPVHRREDAQTYIYPRRVTL